MKEKVYIGSHYDKYDNRFSIKSPYEAKEDIEHLDKSVTARSWEPHWEMWGIRATQDSVQHAVTYLESCGWEVTLSEPAEEVMTGEL